MAGVVEEKVLTVLMDDVSKNKSDGAVHIGKIGDVNC